MGPGENVLAALLRLCADLNKHDVEGVKRNTKIFLDEETYLGGYERESLKDFMLLLISRTFLVGLEAASRDLRSEFLRRGNGRYFSDNDGSLIRPGFAPEIEVFTKIVDDMIANVRLDNAENAEMSVDRLVRTYRLLTREARALAHAKTPRKQTPLGPDLSYASSIQSSTQGESAFYNELVILSAKLVTPINLAFQVLLDDALASTRKGGTTDALIRAKKALEARIEPALNFSDKKLASRDVVDTDFLGKELAATRSSFRGGKGGTYHDIFGAKRDIGFSYFDITQSLGDEKSLQVLRIFKTRELQIAFLDTLHNGPARSAAKAAVSKSNPELLKELGGLDLEKDDAWRTFLLRHFEERKKELGNDELALRATITLFQNYLSAFTISTPYNIDDSGDNYLRRTFPRALTGQLVHDCGVYALRVAYTLSTVRDRLGANFRAIMLPHHIGLIISVKNGAAYVIHNKNITYVSKDEVDDLVTKWSNLDEQGNRRKVPLTSDRDRALAEAAASLFIVRTDIPYRPVQVSTATSGDALMEDLWTMFQTEIKTDVLKPSKNVAQPGLLYLAALDATKRAYNARLVPFWNAVGPDKARPFIEKLKNTTANDPNRKQLLVDYRTELVAVFGKVTQQYDTTSPIKGPSDNSQVMAEYENAQAERDKASDMINKDPQMIAAGASLAPWRRFNLELKALADMWKYLDDHLPNTGKLNPPFINTPRLPYAD
jgi:hypothetical protein